MSLHQGNKATNLIKLQKAGFAVPRLFLCDSSWSENDILADLQKKLSGVEYFAVRSSAESEDSKEQSFAGHFYSALGVTKNNIYNEFLKVCSSFNGAPGSVVVQELIASDVAGVFFTEAGDQKCIINAIHGLCRPVVNGQICDEYICDLKGNLLEKIIAPEKVCEIFNNGIITFQKVQKESLTEEQLKNLILTGNKIQAFFGSPQDIEWCFKNDNLFILQSRPITRAVTLTEQEYFDSANIAESYSGLVLPLTCTFAQMVYSQVYKDLLRMSGISAKKISEHAYIFENLLGFFYGRMYYNMNNWYQLAAFAPGYNRNKKNFELMITSNIRQNITTPITPSLGLKLTYPFIILFKTLTFGLASLNFKRLVQTEMRIFLNLDLKEMDYDECVSLFKNFNSKLLRRWYVAVENDFFVMTYLGILNKLLGQELLQQVITFKSKATEQVGALIKLSTAMQSSGPIWQTIITGDVQKFKKELGQNSKINESLESYLTEFGGRFANELKLESVDIDEDPTKLFSVLKAYSNQSVPNFAPSPQPQLPWLKRMAVKILLRKFKKYAARREEFRLLRSNAFAAMRQIFKRMGELLMHQGIIEDANDIFYLELNEILAFTNQTNNKFIDIINKRKRDYTDYLNTTPPAHFVTTNSQPPVTNKSEVPQKNELQARPASSGVVKGKVRVFKDFYMPEKIDFDILVTSHTDPGWTSLIALSKGLIIEHGGVLSHASIVARELNIPAVIGATGAVNFLKNGQMVEIDGLKGTIKLI